MFYEKESKGLKKANVFAKIDMERVGKYQDGQIIFSLIGTKGKGKLLAKMLNVTKEDFPAFFIIDVFPVGKAAFVDFYKMNHKGEINEDKITSFIWLYKEKMLTEPYLKKIYADS